MGRDTDGGSRRSRWDSLAERRWGAARVTLRLGKAQGTLARTDRCGRRGGTLGQTRRCRAHVKDKPGPWGGSYSSGDVWGWQEVRPSDGLMMLGTNSMAGVGGLGKNLKLGDRRERVDKGGGKSCPTRAIVSQLNLPICTFSPLGQRQMPLQLWPVRPAPLS